MKTRAADPSSIRSSEEINVNVDLPLRLLQPRPELDSRSRTPPKLTPDNTRNSYLTLTAPLQIEGVHIKSELVTSGLDTTKGLPSPYPAFRPPNPVVRLKSSYKIPPLSDGSVNKLVQTASSSGDPLYMIESCNMPGESISIPSIDDPAYARYGPHKDLAVFGNVSRGLFCVLKSTQDKSSLPSMRSKAAGASTYDGPALDMHPAMLKDNSHTSASRFPPIPEDTESAFGMEVIMRDHIEVELASLCGSIATKSEKLAVSKLASGDNLPSSTSLPKESIPGHTSKLYAHGVPKLPGLQGVIVPQSSPIIPIDVTGQAPEPPTPIPNQTMKHKLKIKTRKSIHYTRRVVLRKAVLTLVLGKQLAGPSQNSLKATSRHESSRFEALTAVEPVNAGNVPVATPRPVP